MEKLNRKVSQSDRIALVKTWQQLLRQNQVIAVIRAPQIEIALEMAKAVAAGGISLIEVTWNSRRPATVVSQLKLELPNCSIGAGTILNLDQLRQAIAVGAQFVFCPHFDPTLLEVAQRHQIPLVPGVLTPTEIVTAWQMGATTVKIFPIQAVGGATYLQSLQKPLSQIAFIPTGGVTLDNAKTMLDAGAIAVAISSDLFPSTAVATNDWQAIAQRARTLLSELREK